MPVSTQMSWDDEHPFWEMLELFYMGEHCQYCYPHDGCNLWETSAEQTPMLPNVIGKAPPAVHPA